MFDADATGGVGVAEAPAPPDGFQDVIWHSPALHSTYSTLTCPPVTCHHVTTTDTDMSTSPPPLLPLLPPLMSILTVGFSPPMTMKEKGQT